MCSSWSSKIDFESCRRRPMSVDLPSSTLPTVAKRRGAARSGSVITGSEVAQALAVFHAGLGDAIGGARGAALGDPGDGRLGDDVLDREGRRLDGRRARGVAD